DAACQPTTEGTSESRLRRSRAKEALAMHFAGSRFVAREERRADLRALRAEHESSSDSPSISNSSRSDHWNLHRVDDLRDKGQRSHQGFFRILLTGGAGAALF